MQEINLNNLQFMWSIVWSMKCQKCKNKCSSWWTNRLFLPSNGQKCKDIQFSSKTRAGIKKDSTPGPERLFSIVFLHALRQLIIRRLCNILLSFVFVSFIHKGKEEINAERNKRRINQTQLSVSHGSVALIASSRNPRKTLINY